MQLKENRIMNIAPELLNRMMQKVEENPLSSERVSSLTLREFFRIDKDVKTHMSNVCQIITEINGTLQLNGSGFLIVPDLIVTNHHVLAKISVALRSIAVFHKFSAEGQVIDTYYAELNPLEEKEGYFWTGIQPVGSSSLTLEELDYTIVAIKPTQKIAQTAFSILELTQLVVNDRIFILHHPKKEVKNHTDLLNSTLRVSIGTINSINQDKEMHYNSDTAAGSSGGPVIKSGGLLAGLHRRTMGECHCTPNNHTCNSGIPIAAIWAHIPAEELEKIKKRCTPEIPADAIKQQVAQYHQERQTSFLFNGNKRVFDVNAIYTELTLFGQLEDSENQVMRSKNPIPVKELFDHEKLRDAPQRRVIVYGPPGSEKRSLLK